MDKFAQEGCDSNQDNAIDSEDIQTSGFAYSREVYLQGEVYNGTKRKSRTLTDKSKEYQLNILFEKKKKLHARLTRKCKLIDDLMYSSNNVMTVKEEIDQFNYHFKKLVSCTKIMFVCCHKECLMKKMTGLKQSMKLRLLRTTKYTIRSKELKITINQDPVEVHQKNHQGEAPRNLQVLQKPSHQEVTKNGRVTDRSIIHRRKACCYLQP